MAKKVVSLLLCFLGGALFLWYVWPGVTSPPSFDLDYFTMVSAVILGFGALAFLVLIVSNERLARIEHGRLVWPFPFIKKSGGRTRYVVLEEITKAELTVDSRAHRGARLILSDGTQMFLPQTALGVDQSDLLEALMRYLGKSPARSSGASREQAVGITAPNDTEK